MKKRIIAFSFVLLLLFSLLPVSIFAIEPSSDETERYDLSETSIKEDFETIFNNVFDVDDYRPNPTKSTIQVVALTEYKNAAGETELYIYLYNPSQKRIYDKGENKITLALEDDYQKYNLEKIDVRYCTVNTTIETNASLLKYKIVGFDRVLTENVRKYTVSELEFRYNIGVKSQAVGKTFTFVDNENGTSDVITGGQELIDITDIGQTYYRVQSDVREKSQDIRTVYFAVDSITEAKYGLMDSVTVNWEEKELKPILLLDNEYIVNAFNKEATNNTGSVFKYSFGAGMRPGLITGLSLGVGHCGTEFKYGYNVGGIPNRFYAGTDRFFDDILNGALLDFVYSEHYHNLNVADFDGQTYDEIIDKIYLSFYSDLKDDIVRFDELLPATDEFDGTLDGLYSDVLFSSSNSYDGTFYIGEMTKLDQYEIDTSLLKYVLSGWKHTTTNVGEIEFARFEKLDRNMLNLPTDELCSYYKIAREDIIDFRKFCMLNEDKNIYFLRYSVTDTYAYEASIFGDNYLSTGYETLDKVIPQAECYACNGTLVETTMINDFDIITLGFKAENGSYTIVPVNSTPTDHMPSIEQLQRRLPDDKQVQDDINSFLNTFKNALIIISILLVVVVISIIVSIILIIVNISKKRKARKNEKKNI